MANLPLPGTELSDPDDLAGAIPDPVQDLLRRLWSAGHAAYVVGGALRDALLGRSTTNWDLATAALPEQTAALFEDAAYENRFGTVVLQRDGQDYEITTFRTDHDYADFRRPHRVEFGASLEADLARRDFTMNALAWGAPDAATRPGLVDPHEGRSDIAARLIRAVGEPDRRFEEDALRMLRAVRFSAILGFEVEPTTLDALRRHAPLVAHLSGERIAVELDRILGAPRPSDGLRLLSSTGILEHVSPDLAAQRGIAQNKIPGEDLWDHTVRTVDATTRDAAGNRAVVRLAALVHDIGKPATAADGHFYRHEVVGAELAEGLLDRLHVPRSTAARVAHLVRHHMFRYESTWSDAAIRRFLAKVGPDAIEDLFALREADNEGSGVPRDSEGLTELRARVAAELAAGPILDRSALAIDGSDLMRELGLPQGPALGRILATLFERVVEEPHLNDRPTLMLLARDLAERSAAERSASEPPR